MTHNIKLTPTEPVEANIPDGVENTVNQSYRHNFPNRQPALLTASSNHFVQNQEH